MSLSDHSIIGRRGESCQKTPKGTLDILTRPQRLLLAGLPASRPFNARVECDRLSSIAALLNLGVIVPGTNDMADARLTALGRAVRRLAIEETCANLAEAKR